MKTDKSAASPKDENPGGSTMIDGPLCEEQVEERAGRRKKPDRRTRAKKPRARS